MNQHENRWSLFIYEHGKIEKMKRLIKLVDSTSNGLNFKKVWEDKVWEGRV